MNGYMKIIIPKDVKINVHTVKKLHEAGFVDVSKNKMWIKFQIVLLKFLRFILSTFDHGKH